MRAEGRKKSPGPCSLFAEQFSLCVSAVSVSIQTPAFKKKKKKKESHTCTLQVRRPQRKPLPSLYSPLHIPMTLKKKEEKITFCRVRGVENGLLHPINWLTRDPVTSCHHLDPCLMLLTKHKTIFFFFTLLLLLQMFLSLRREHQSRPSRIDGRTLINGWSFHFAALYFSFSPSSRGLWLKC